MRGAAATQPHSSPQPQPRPRCGRFRGRGRRRGCGRRRNVDIESTSSGAQKNAISGASVWIATLEMDSPGARVENGVGVGVACKGSLKGRFKGPFKEHLRPSEGSDGRNAEL